MFIGQQRMAEAFARETKECYCRMQWTDAHEFSESFRLSFVIHPLAARRDSLATHEHRR